MIFRAVLCPGAPLLIPGLAESLEAQVPDLVQACDSALDGLREVDLVLLLCSGPRVRDSRPAVPPVSLVHPAGTLLSSALLTGTSAPPHFTAQVTGESTGAGSPIAAASPAPSTPGIGAVVGMALLARAGLRQPVTVVELGDENAEVTAVLRRAMASPDRVGLLVIAEGSASRGPESPGGGAAGAEQLDASLATALADGDPAALGGAASMDAGSATGLLFTSAPALLALAELTASDPPQRAELLFDQAPLGVGYLVAVWSWAAGA